MAKRPQFSEAEVAALLTVKGVGQTVIQRFEEIGIASFDQLKTYTAEEIAEKVASMLNNTCWKNSPIARNAINAAIDLAKNSHPERQRRIS